MLKIEKNRCLFVPREPFFSTIFWKSFGIACLLHGIGLTLFTFKPVFLNEKEFPSSFSPTLVEAMQKIEVAKLETRDLPSLHAQFPSPSTPRLEKIPSVLFTSSPGLISKEEKAIPCFSQLEDFRFEERLQPKTELATSTHLVIVIDKNLGLNEMVEDGTSLLVKEAFANLRLEKKQLSFKVQLDQRSGTLFWFELEGDEPSPQHLQKALQVLRSVRFRPQHFGLIAEGRMEIHFV